MRGEFRPRVLSARSTSGVLCRVTDVAPNHPLLAATATELGAKSISGAQRRRLTTDMLWRPNSRRLHLVPHFPPSTYVLTLTFIPSVSMVICPFRSVL